jgi:hypothetical protein
LFRRYAAKVLYVFCCVSLVSSVVLFFVLGVHYWPVYLLSILGFVSFAVYKRLRRSIRSEAE